MVFADMSIEQRKSLC